MSGDVDPDIPSTGAVFTFGKSRFADNVPSHFFIKNDPIVDIACGDQHTAIVCQNGRVFTFGSNEWGQLGLNHSNPIYKPSCLKSIKTIKCTNVALGRAHTLIRTAEGKIYSCGANSEGQLGVGDTEPRNSPHLVDSLHGVKAIVAGSNHSAALTETGEVYIWGSNSEGQLGLGKDTSTVTLPEKIQLVDPPCGLAVGYYHTLILTEGGNLWSCGEGDGGRLGLGHEESVFTPEKVKVPESIKFKKLAAGGSHSVAIDAEGLLYVWGNNDLGQLGLESETSVLEPKLCLEEKRFHFVAAGQQHSAFITDGGNILLCGETRHGKLGTDWAQDTFLCKPSHIPKLTSLNIIKVACGGCHTAILAAPRNQSVCQILIENTETPPNVGKTLPPLIKKISNSNLLNPPDQVLSPPLNHIVPLSVNHTTAESHVSCDGEQDVSEDSEQEEDSIRTSSAVSRNQAWQPDQYDAIESLDQQTNSLVIEKNIKNASLHQNNQSNGKKNQSEGKISRFFSRLRKSPSISSADIQEISNGIENNAKDSTNEIISHEAQSARKSKMCIVL